MLNRELVVYGYISHSSYNYYPNGEHPAVWSCCRKEAASTCLGEEVADRPQHPEPVLLPPLHQRGQSSSSSAHLNLRACTSVSVDFC